MIELISFIIGKWFLDVFKIVQVFHLNFFRLIFLYLHLCWIIGWRDCFVFVAKIQMISSFHLVNWLFGVDSIWRLYKNKVKEKQTGSNTLAFPMSFHVRWISCSQKKTIRNASALGPMQTDIYIIQVSLTLRILSGKNRNAHTHMLKINILQKIACLSYAGARDKHSIMQSMQSINTRAAHVRLRLAFPDPVKQNNFL